MSSSVRASIESIISGSTARQNANTRPNHLCLGLLLTGLVDASPLTWSRRDGISSIHAVDGKERTFGIAKGGVGVGRISDVPYVRTLIGQAKGRAIETTNSVMPFRPVIRLADEVSLALSSKA